MVFTWLRRLIHRKAGAVAGSVGAPAGLAVDAGLEVRTPREILAANADLMQRLRLHAALDEAHFASRFEQPLLRLAAYINVLPASASSLFSDPAGWFRAALETGYFAFQAADGRIFTGSEGVERRHALEARWRYVCFLAGMFHPIGRTLERIVVSGAGAGAGAGVWQHGPGGVTQWAQEAGVQRLFVTWAGGDADDTVGPSPASLPILAGVVGPGNLQMLRDGDAQLVEVLYRLAAGKCSKAHIADELVASCWQRIAEREAARRPEAVRETRPGAIEGCAEPGESTEAVTRSDPLPAPLSAPSVTAVSPLPAATPIRAASPIRPASPVTAPPPARAAQAPQQASPPAPAQIRHTEYVAAEVRAAIGSPMQVERLGKVVKAWRERGDDSTVMQRTEEGAAIELTFLARLMPNVPSWVDAMAREGLVYVAPQTPGLRIQKVAMAEGRPPVPALVLSNLACRRLGL